MDKIIIVDKPKGVTSHDVVLQYRKKLGIRKIGHAGTLDPFATGVLILLVGKARKRFEELKDLEKEYEMIVELGWETDSLDLTGQVIRILRDKDIGILREINRTEILKVLKSFVGEYEQEVPKYSAKKIKGKPMYWYVRKGKEIPEVSRVNHLAGGRLAKRVEIKNIRLQGIRLQGIRLQGIRYPQIKIRVVCGSGTYMRTLARDIGKKLGLPSVAVELRRVRVGKYCLAMENRG